MALAVVASPSDAELQRTLSALLSGVDWTTTTTGQVRALLSSKFNGVDLEHRKGLIVQQINSFFQEANDYENKTSPYQMTQTLSPALREFMGGGAQTARYQDVVTHLWAHVRQHNLQSGGPSGDVSCDAELKKLFGNRQSVSLFDLAAMLAPHLKNTGKPTASKRRPTQAADMEQVFKAARIEAPRLYAPPTAALLALPFGSMPPPAPAKASAQPKEKAARKLQDPDKPKRARSAYAYFMQGIRSTVTAEHPTLSFGEVGKEVGRRWNLLTDAEKAPYFEKATRDRQRADEQQRAYVAPPQEVLRAKRKTGPRNYWLRIGEQLRTALDLPEELSSVDLLKRLNAHFRSKNMLDPTNKRFVKPDDAFKQLLDTPVDRFATIVTVKLLKHHITQLHKMKPGGGVPGAAAGAAVEADEEEEEEGWDVM